MCVRECSLPHSTVADSELVSCRWNFTNTATNETQVFNGTCASPGSKSAGPWCYVQPNTCKHQPLKDQTGQSYDNCATNTSTHTLDTCKCHMLCLLSPEDVSRMERASMLSWCCFKHWQSP